MDSWHELDRRCTGLNRAGERCGRSPIRGGSVCLLHGGGIPQVQAAAKLRLLAMVEPVLGVFESILETYNSTRCDKCGKPTGDAAPVIRVGQLVLDRAGFHPSLTLVAAPPPVDAFANLTENELLTALNTRIEKLTEHRDLILRSRAFAVYQGPDAFNTAEGYIIEDDDDAPLNDANTLVEASEPEVAQTGSENIPQHVVPQALTSRDPVSRNGGTNGPNGEPEVDGPKPQGVLDLGEVDDAE